MKPFIRKLNKTNRQEFALKQYRAKRTPFLVVAAMISAFELFMVVSSLVTHGFGFESESSRRYFFLYVVLFALTVLCAGIILLCKRFFEKKPEFFLGLCVLYAFCICAWGSYLSAYSHRHTADISVYLYVCICVAVLIPMRLWQAVTLYSANWVFFILMLHRFLGPGLDPFSSQLNSAFTALLCICIAAMMQRTQVEEFISAKTILKQNEKIRRMNARLRSMVTVDELTQIHNRRFMDREFPLLLEKAREERQPVAMLLLDIDDFKKYNDRYGHQAGDDCLHRVAGIVTDMIPGEGAYFARYGGEEFVMLLVNVEPEDARALGEDIRREVERADIPHRDSAFGRVTVSIGLCNSRPGGKATLSQLVFYADSAMYSAKSGGKNQLFVYRYTQIPGSGGAGAPPEPPR